MRNRRRLTLARETLTELRTDELVNVQGANQAITPIAACAENLASKLINCVSIFDPCPTR